MSKTQVETKGRELTITHVFDAPRKLVFETHSDCKHLKHWWGPRTWPLSYCKMDFRTNGTWHYSMKGPNPGDESWGKVMYKDIKAPERIAYMDYFSDKDGNVNKDLPAGEVTMEFTEQNGKTKVTSVVKYPTEVDLKKVLEMGMIEGMSETLDRLEEYLATKPAAKG